MTVTLRSGGQRHVQSLYEMIVNRPDFSSF